MSKVKTSGIISDVDNTLIATNLFVEKHIIRTCKKLKIKSPNKKTILKVQKENLPFEQIFDELFGKPGKKVLKAYRETAPNINYVPTPHALEFIKRTDQLNIPVVIVTNRVRMVEDRLEQAGFDLKSFEGIVSLNVPKPGKHAYDSALEHLNKLDAKKDSISFIGDHPHDFMAVPESLKSNFYAVLTGLSTKQEFEYAGASSENIFNDFNEIIDIIALADG